jgi:hypothetical protein
MMLQEYIGDYMSMHEHTMVSDSSQRHAEMCSGIQRGVEYGDVSPLQQYIVLGGHLHSSSSHRGDDDWDSMMITGEYLPQVPVDEILVESLGLTKAHDTFQSYSQLQMFLLSFFDTFIMDNIRRGDRQWQRTWRVVRRRPPDMNAFMAYSRIEVDHHGQIVETLCVMVSILGHGITDILENDTDTYSHRDVHGGLSTVISMTQEPLVGIGSDKLPSLPWDLGVHFVGRLFHLMMTQVAPESHILPCGLVLSGIVGACPIERENFSLLILMIEHGDDWTDTTSTEVLLQM